MKRIILLSALLAVTVFAQRPGFRLPDNLKADQDIVYKTVDGHHLRLDLYLPEKADAPLPLIVWIHGGGWKNGSKENCLPLRLGFVEKGYALASINYRLTAKGPFPAQIEDCKAAIRWLRAHADEYGINPEEIGAWGSSAGGHLVALLGTSGGIEQFDTGENLQTSSRVQAVCDYYGPADFQTMGSVPGFERHNQPNSPESLLLGGPALEMKAQAVAASPITYVSKEDPPFLIVHGKKDRVVPVQQSESFQKKLSDAGVESELIILPESGHGGPGFSQPQVVGKVADFFDKHLK